MNDKILVGIFMSSLSLCIFCEKNCHKNILSVMIGRYSWNCQFHKKSKSVEHACQIFQGIPCHIQVTSWAFFCCRQKCNEYFVSHHALKSFWPPLTGILNNMAAFMLVGQKMALILQNILIIHYVPYLNMTNGTNKAKCWYLQ